MPDVRVLLVEPDGAMRRATARVLRDHFEVTQAHDAVRALELILDAPPFDVVVATVESPLLEGLALVKRLAEDRNALAQRCLVLSSDAPILRSALRERAVEVLTQPVRIGALVDAVRRMAVRR